MKQFKTELGFTLIEMAFVILIMGLIVGSVFSFYTPQMDLKRRQVTIERQEKIALALSDYAQRQGRLPCPSPVSPFVNMGIQRATCTTEANRDGIVPYRDLGLTQQDATDGFGNPFTYGVARELTSNVGTTTYRNYRTTVWIASGANLNRTKAIICGQRVTNNAQQIEIYNDTVLTNPNHITGIQEDNTPALAGGDFANPNTAGTLLTGRVLAYFAYALVSHGPNGEGAYVFSTESSVSTGRRAFENAYTSDIENADTDREFIVMPTSEAPTNTDFFDDIVLWRTQESLIRDAADDTCARP